MADALGDAGGLEDIADLVGFVFAYMALLWRLVGWVEGRNPTKLLIQLNPPYRSENYFVHLVIGI
jgi:hypothetical protein